jgi:methylthioribose-1-phosphate isomerase
MFDAIKNMVVRGAPAIGIAGAHGVVLYAQELKDKNLSFEEFKKELLNKSDYLVTSRPTAVNLYWAVEKQKEIIKNSTSDIESLIEELRINGKKLELEDIEINKKIGITEPWLYQKAQQFLPIATREHWQRLDMALH